MNPCTRSLFFFSVLSFFIAGCARSIQDFKTIIPPTRDVSINYDSSLNEELKILYVTCGMLIIEKGDNAFLFDPYFSYQKFSQIPFGVKTRQRFYNSFKHTVESTIDRNKVRTAFVSHAHYDHLMDLPVLLKDHYFPNLKTVYGSEFVPAMMYHYRNEGTQISAIQQDEVYNPLEPSDTAFQWLSVGEDIQVLPIATMHAPHKNGMLVMNSDLDEAYFKKDKFKNPYARSKGFKWDAGCNYSFLVRIKKADGSYFKIIVQTSGSHSPYGLPPAGEKADMAILCFASTQEVKDYPNYLVEATGAKKLVLIHWEDFFRYPRSPDDIRIVRGTNRKIVKQRLAKLKESALNPEVIMPRPGTLMTVKY
jgi:hypothetical protein